MTYADALFPAGRAPALKRIRVTARHLARKFLDDEAAGPTSDLEDDVSVEQVSGFVVSDSDGDGTMHEGARFASVVAAGTTAVKRRGPDLASRRSGSNGGSGTGGRRTGSSKRGSPRQGGSAGSRRHGGKRKYRRRTPRSPHLNPTRGRLAAAASCQRALIPSLPAQQALRR